MSVSLIGTAQKQWRSQLAEKNSNRPPAARERGTADLTANHPGV